MKKLAFCILFFTGLVGYSQNYEWINPVKFENLAMPGGKHLFYQFCIPEDDSLIINGSLTFKKAILPNIDRCSITQYVKDTVYTHLEIATKGTTFTLQLQEYFLKLVQSNFLLTEYKNIIQMSGCHISKERNLAVNFVKDKKLRHGFLTILDILE